MKEGAKVGDLRSATGFFRGLRPFLVRMPPLAEARLRLDRQMAERERTLASALDRAVFRNSGSAYGHLLRWAGSDLNDIVRLLTTNGLSATLEQLYEAGVYVTLEEFKGRRPIVRSGLEIHPQPGDFDNPLTAKQYEARTGG